MSWRKFIKRNHWYAERAAEIDSYLAIETEENIARGMRPAEAAAAARRKFGNPMLVQEEIYHMNSVSRLESIGQDLSYGARLLAASPGFALVAILSLALGIGANTAIFQLMNALRLRSLPVQDPGQLVEVRIAGGNHGLGLNQEYGQLTRPIWKELQRNHPAFSGVFAWSKRRDTIGEGSATELVSTLYVTGDAFRTLGERPWRGRLILPEDEHGCPASSVIVSYAYWHSKMGGRELGADSRILLDGGSAQVVGVTPPSFFGPVVGESFDIAVPFCEPKELARNVFDVTVMGRLRPGVSITQATAELNSQSPGIMAATEVTGYDAATVARYRQFRLAAYPAAAGVSNLRNAYDSSLWLLLAITGLVLLIACANLANLMLARASSREREIAVRLALGAARYRLLRQLLVESFLLAAVGAGLGVALAALLSRAMVWGLSTGQDSIVLSTATDWRVLLFAAALTMLTCVIFGMIPAFRASGVDPVTALKTGGRGMTANRERFSLQRTLVVLQISVSLVLLVGALLFVSSFHKLLTFNPGMREQGITVAFIGFDRTHVALDGIDDFKRRLLDDVRSMPGVQSAAETSYVPLLGGSWEHTITVGTTEATSKFSWVSPGYFNTMDIPLLSGRDISVSDTSGSKRVAVVNKTFVQKFLNGRNPLGVTLRTHQEPGYPSTVYEIVGVIPDTRYDSIRSNMLPMVFAPLPQYPQHGRWTSMVIRSNLEPTAAALAVKHRLAEKYPAIIVEAHEFQALIHNRLVPERLMAMLSGFFGILAALLATVGLYGVLSYVTERRRNEIGIRVAVGASRAQVIQMIMREAGALILFGTAIGLVLALVAGRTAGSLLFGVKPYDPFTLITAIVLLALIGALASFLPAQHASKLDPMTALRSE